MPKTYTCKYCQSSGFTWKKTPQGFRLQSPDGTLHSCRTGGEAARPKDPERPERPTAAPEPDAPTARATLPPADLRTLINSALDYAEQESTRIIAAAEAAASQIERPAPQTLHVQFPDAPAKRLATPASKYLAEALPYCHARLNLLLKGPAGCGKSHLIQQIAETMTLPFGHLCFTAGASESWLFGRQTPTGYIPSNFINLYDSNGKGGVFGGEEFDAADANTMLALNVALANGHLVNPINGKTYKRHPDFIFIACANTFGKGPDHVYTGRNALDGATLDRFWTIEMDYDRGLEQTLCPDKALRDHLWSVRDKLREAQSSEIISTRKLKEMSELYALGVPVPTLLQSLACSWPETIREQTKVLEWTGPVGPAPVQSRPTEEETAEVVNADEVPF